MGRDPPRAGAVHHHHDRGSAEDYPHDARREVSGQAQEGHQQTTCGSQQGKQEHLGGINRDKDLGRF